MAVRVATPPSPARRPFPVAPLVVGFLLIILMLFGFGLTMYGIYVVIAVLLASRLMTANSLTNLIETRTLSRRQCEAGETVTVSTEIKNHGAAALLWVMMEDFARERAQIEGERLQVAMMRPGKVTLLKYQARLPYRGYYAFGPVLFETGDLFGLVRKFKVGASVDYVTVLPKVITIAKYSVPTHRPIGEVRVQSLIFEDPSLLAGIRPYTLGDSLKRVHWKATARTGAMQSKIYDPTTMLGALVTLDFHASSWTGDGGFARSEFAVTAAASIGAFILEHKQQVGFLSNGRDAVERIEFERETLETATRAAMRASAAEELISDRLRPVEVPTRRGDGHLQNLLVTLARLEMTDGLTLAATLATEYHRLPRDLALICLLGKFTRDLGEALLEMKRCGFLVVAFVIDSAMDYQQAVGYLSAEGIRVGHLRDDGDLNELAVARL